MKVAAIDFETANAQRNSACSIGIAISDDDRNITCHHFYIKPVPCDFNDFNIQIHGITPEDVINEPTLPELWPQIWSLLNGALVIAHNAPFDMSVLRASLNGQGGDFSFEYVDTCAVARKFLPNLPNHKLNTLCDYFNIELDHHKADNDAKAALELFFRLTDIVDCPTPETFLEIYYDDLAKRYDNIDHSCNNFFGSLFSINCNDVTVQLGCSKTYRNANTKHGDDLYTEIDFDFDEEEFNQRKFRRGSGDYADIHINWDEINKYRPAYPLPGIAGKSFCVTGKCITFERQRLLEWITLFGGIAMDNVTSKTDVLIVGNIPTKKKSPKLQMAENLKENGGHIQIITEDDYWKMIPTDTETILSYKDSSIKWSSDESVSRASSYEYPSCHRDYISVREINAIDTIYEDDDFLDKSFCLTGELSIPRKKAMEIISKLGGTVTTRVTKKTNYLLIGSNVDYNASKMKKALAAIEAGQNIQIIDEDDFCRMIDDEAGIDIC